MREATQVIGNTIAYGRQRYRVDKNGNWQALFYGSHGPNDPPVGLSWKWRHIKKNQVPDEVKKAGK